MARKLVVKVTCGAEDPERCNQAFTVSAAAVAAGAEVSLWLTGEAAWFAVPGRAESFELPLAAPLADLLLFTRHWGFEAADVQVPVRWWHGESDHIVPHRHGIHLAGRLPLGEFRTISGESHLGGLGRARAVLEELMELGPRTVARAR